MNLRQRTNELKYDIPAVFLALKHTQTPLMAKVIAGVTIAYALSPIDLIPDFIPVLGQLDDVILLPIFVAITIKLIPEEVFEECRVNAEGMWANGKPKRWYYAVPIMIFWLLILWFIIKAAG